MENSKISWTHHSFNPWRGCAKVSAGCRSCYAERLVTTRHRLPVWGEKAERKIAADSTWKQPIRWNRWAKKAGVRMRVFCSSLADVFEVRPDLAAPRARLARLIEATPHLDWLLLTKRPETMAQFAREDMGWSGSWPANVWAGTSVEHQQAANERIPHLLRVPARVRFLSVEPLLESVDLAQWLVHREPEPQSQTTRSDNPTISLVIVGGESGPSARPFDLAWARSIRDQCKDAGVPFFFKQGGRRPLLDGAPLKLRDPKGGNLDEIPEDLRIRELP
jgi:protein gp37